MTRLFSAYVIVDWSAAAKPATGADSVWIGVLKRDVRFRMSFESHNPATRQEAEKILAAVLDDLKKRGERALLGFDFPLGFPRGFADALKLTGEAPWRAVWDQIDKMIKDKADNTNNRYQVAAKMNRLMTDEAWPFWGAPAKQAQRWLTTTKPPQGTGDILEFRATEDAARKGRLQPKSVWQMHGAGAVGGQTLVGVPVVRRLLEKLGPSAAVWPFGTGWRELTPADVEPLSALVVEVWPSMFDGKPAEGEYKDQAQVRSTAEALARMDDAGELGRAFAPPKGATAELIEKVEQEEGWILGA